MSTAVEEAIDRGVEERGRTRATIPIESVAQALRELLPLGAEVLAPPELRDRLREVARAMTELYARRRVRKCTPTA